jgi:hypothetical protein
MEVMNVVRARSLWLCDLNDLNPYGKSLDGLSGWLKNAYGFSKVPSSPTDLEKDTNALAFLEGAFQLPDGSVRVDLRIYKDGLVADTQSSTRDTDSFLEDALSRVAKEFKLLYKPEIVHTRSYVSELIVHCELPLVNLNQRLEAFGAKLTKIAKMPKEPQFALSGLAFWDTSALAQGNPPAFRFERQWNMPSSQNRYYSLAPAHTDEHLDLLKDLEMILSGAPA